jgi:Fe(3+) dicitrate transport protein
MPGLGLHMDLGSGWGLVAGVHRGYSPPSPSSTEEVEPEESVNWELGVRWISGRSNFELVGFYNDYSNLLGTDTASGGGTGTGDQFNGGEVEVQGLELGFGRELVNEGQLRVPIRVAYSYTHGEFANSFETGFADWEPEVLDGDELPYLPEHRFYVELGLELGDFAGYLNLAHVSEMRTTAGQGAITEDERIEDHLTADLSASWRFSDRWRLLLNVRNLSDEVYVAARRPYGLRPGLSRTTTLGVAIDF